MMYKKFWFYLLLCLCFNVHANPVHLGHSTASLVSEYDVIKPNQSFWVALKIQTHPGWHVYWKNPGDSGMAPRINWDLPKGLQGSDIKWLPPKRIKVAHLMNYGYEGEVYFLVKIKNHASQTKDIVDLVANAEWLICKEDCVPEQAILRKSIQVGDEPQASADNFPISVQRDRINAITKIKGRIALGKQNLYLAIDPKMLVDQSLKSLYFYPEIEGVIKPASKQVWSFDNSLLNIQLERDVVKPKQGLNGLLALNVGNRIDYYQVQGEVDPMLSTDTTYDNLLLILLMAFFGGIILNAMPCVFPVLSIKAISIAKKASAASGEIRLQSLAYTAGIVLSFVALASVLILMKQAGHAIGWGYQLQSPTFVTILIYILFLVGLNLSGYFEVNVAVGHISAADRQDYVGSFMTGVLATLVATPCTAPFMATAVGYALTQSGAHTLLVFVVLGLGLAFPFLLLSFIPSLLRFLPKPGQWMVTMREVLAFPIYLTCVWLLWVLAHQIDSNQLAMVMAGLVFIAGFLFAERSLVHFGFWIKNAFRTLLLLGVLWPFYCFNAHSSMYQEEAYTPQRLQLLTSQHKAVFVHATAAWCITCKANEMLVLSRQSIRQAFIDHDVTVLKADWTNRDATVTHFLAKFKRSGVPLYVFYPKKGEPKVLPQILTETIVKDAIKQE